MFTAMNVGPATSAAHVTCSRCSTAMAARDATYDNSGLLLCRKCAAVDSIAHAEKRASSSLVSSAIAVPGIALASLFINPFFLVSIGALVSGLAWLITVAGDRVNRARLGRKLVPCVVAVLFGVLIALSTFAAFALWLVGLTHRS